MREGHARGREVRRVLLRRRLTRVLALELVVGRALQRSYVVRAHKLVVMETVLRVRWRLVLKWVVGRH